MQPTATRCTCTPRSPSDTEAGFPAVSVVRRPPWAAHLCVRLGAPDGSSPVSARIERLVLRLDWHCVESRSRLQGVAVDRGVSSLTVTAVAFPVVLLLMAITLGPAGCGGGDSTTRRPRQRRRLRQPVSLRLRRPVSRQRRRRHPLGSRSSPKKNSPGSTAKTAERPMSLWMAWSTT